MPVEFASKHRALRLVRRPVQEQVLPNGSVARVAPEVVYEFEQGNGSISVEPGRDILADGPWVDGAPSEQDSLTWMRNHPEYNVLFHEILPAAPDPGFLYAQAMDFAAADDADSIHDLYTTEKASWNRGEVLERLAKLGQSVETSVSAVSAPLTASKD